MILLASLFGYPGLGHLMIGARKTGFAFVIVFTALTVGLVAESFSIFGGLVSALKWAVELGQGQFDTDSLKVNWGRLIFWTVSTFVVWIASGLDAFRVAKKQPRVSLEMDPGLPSQKRELFVPKEKV